MHEMIELCRPDCCRRKLALRHRGEVPLAGHERAGHCSAPACVAARALRRHSAASRDARVSCLKRASAWRVAMYRGTAMVACLPVLRGFEPRGDREDVQDPACDSYTESRDDETACHGHQDAGWLTADHLEPTYSLVDRIVRLSLGELADFGRAKYDGDFSLSLEEAQRRKHEFVGEQIGIGPGRRVLDLGCGWAPFSTSSAAVAARASA